MANSQKMNLNFRSNTYLHFLNQRLNTIFLKKYFCAKISFRWNNFFGLEKNNDMIKAVKTQNFKDMNDKK